MTIWTQEDQEKILSWPYVYDIAIFEGDTKNKHIGKKGWREEDYSKIDFKQRLESGLYDQGICIALGKTISGSHYTFALDFDGWDGIIAWFGGDTKEETWKRVLALSRRTRVEWHSDFDDGKIHVILKSHHHLGPNRRIHIGNTLLEIRCDKQALFVSPSIHKDGNRYGPLDTSAIEIIGNNDLLRTQAKIDSLTKDYMSDEDRQKYDEWLDKADTILGVNQGRHDVTKFKIIRYFWKHNGEWLYYSDDQRFEKAWGWHLQHCNPPRSREEFDRICKWVIETFRKQRDKTHEEIRNSRNNFSGISGCISYQINSDPDRFIVSTPDNKLIERVHKYVNVGKNTKQKEKVEYNSRTFLCCKPVRIIKHRNPLSFLNKLQKYTIQFVGSEPSGNFTLRQKTLSQILSFLKESQALTDKTLDVALIAQIKGFERAKLLEENDDIDYTGFLPADGKKSIICSNIEINDNIDVGELRAALDFVDKLAETAYKDRLELLSHILLFGLIAPCSFIFKCIKAPCLEWTFFYGSPNSSKTSSGKVVLALDGHENDQDYNVNMQHVDTLARMGETISRTTFPKAVDEMELVDKYAGKELTTITGAMKSAIDQPVFRKVLDRNRNEDLIPALSALMMTSNPPPPLHNTALVKRLRIRHFSVNETHFIGNIDAITYDKEILASLWKLHPMGQFRNRFVMENQAMILDTKLRPFEKARKILTALYEFAGDRIPPEWFKQELEQTLLEESLIDSKQQFFRHLRI